MALLALAWAGSAGAVSRQPVYSGAEVIEATLPERDLFPGSITQGPDGNMWFALIRGDPGHTASEQQHLESMIARMTPTGQLTEFPLPTPRAGARSLVSGPGGDIWFLNEDGVGRMNMAGQVTMYPVATDLESQMVVGPDGNLWFTRRDDRTFDAIVRVTPVGQVSEFHLPRESGVHGITVGPDGNLWFTEIFRNQIGRIGPNGQISEFPLAGRSGEITVGPDDNLWFTQSGGIGRMTPAADLLDPLRVGWAIWGMVAGPDGRVWTWSGPPALGRVTSDGRTSRIPLASRQRAIADVAPGPDGEVWFTAGGQPPCEGGGGTCMATIYSKPGVVGRIVSGRLEFVFQALGSSVRRREATLGIACKGGDAAAVCRGAIRLSSGSGDLIARRRVVLKTDEARSVVLSFAHKGKGRPMLRQGQSVVATATIRSGQQAEKRFTVGGR